MEETDDDILCVVDAEFVIMSHVVNSIFGMCWM